jgi:hypothetical protein
MHRVAEYDADLTALGLEDHELDRSPRLGSPWLPLILIGQVLMVYILLPPILVIGVIVNLPPAILTVLIARRMAGAAKDEASLKIIIGSVVFPIAWVGAAASVAFGVVRLETLFPGLPNAPLVAGILTALFGATGGVVALRYRRLSRETMRALRVRFTRRRRASEIERLREERAFLCDRALTLGEGLDLPGEVAADGRVI